MPSPVAHGLAGLALDRIFRRVRGSTPDRGESGGPGRLTTIVLVLFAANAADLDFLPGLFVGAADIYHRGPTHSLVAAVGFGVAAALAAHRLAWPDARRWGVFLGAVYASHLVLDLLTVDFGTPYGLPVFWPFSTVNVILPVYVFIYIRRSVVTAAFVQSLFSIHNMYAVLWELVVMGLVLTIVHLLTGGLVRRT